MIPVLIAIAALSLVAFLAFRWFERYRYTDAWRHGELRAVTLSFLMWFGGLFGHRVPPPPQPKVEFATRAEDGETPSPDPQKGAGNDSASGGPPLSDQATRDKQ